MLLAPVCRCDRQRARGLVVLRLLADRLRAPGAAAAAARFWSADWSVTFAFAAVALELAEFDCLTSPLSPGLRMRTEMFALVGCVWEAPDSAARGLAAPAA